MIPLKPDADEIIDFLDELKKHDWIQRSGRRWWPDFVMHYSAIPNVAQILRDGYLYSRRQLDALGRARLDSASPEVIEGTEGWVLDCVRSYFRPLTPTQYHTEGIRTQGNISSLLAHCPTPVYLMFDAGEILTRADCQFSNGNLASPGAFCYSGAADLRNLPWRLIYHQGYFQPGSVEGASITFHRCAEVVIPDRLDLTSLKFLYCRSEAEKETLLDRLTTRLRKMYEKKIVASTRSMVFFRNHTFVERVTLAPDSVRFQFSPDTRSSGPFRLELVARSSDYSQDLVHSQDDFMINDELRINLPESAEEYSISLHLNDHLAYSNSYKAIRKPV